MKNETYARDWLVLLGMLIGLAIFYRASYQLPITILGLMIFTPLAMIRPDLALVFVPFTVPLFFMPKGIWDERFGIRAEGLRIPIHEVVLLITTGAVAVRWLVQQVKQVSLSQNFSPKRQGAFEVVIISSPLGRRTQGVEGLPNTSDAKANLLDLRSLLTPMLPILCFLLAGTIGVVIALPEGRRAALREWRWLIVEPVIFYGLLLMVKSETPTIKNHVLLVTACVLSGALVGLIGMLQYVGWNLAPFLGDEVGFSQDMMFVEGVFRVNSVYGHPNNLALTMERIWPVACVLALAAYEAKQRTRAIFYAFCGLFSFGGMYVAFSKGAQLGSIGALLVILGFQTYREIREGKSQPDQSRRRFLPLIILVTIFVWMIISGLRVERLNLFGASSDVRMKTWASAMEMIRDHPITGLGLDQFNHYYQQYIDPSLKGTTEWFISHPHNLVLDIWLRMGILGLVAFAWLIVRFFWHVFQSFPSSTHDPSSKTHPWTSLSIGFAAAMTAAIIHGMVDNFYFVPDLAFLSWMMFGLAQPSQYEESI